MANDSSTGGPLQPIPTGPTPLEGQALNRFIVAWIAGITGLSGSLIRPRWQPFPANPPTLAGAAPAPGVAVPIGATCWAAVGVTERTKLGFPAITHDAAANGGDGQDVMDQQEILEITASFYDQGVGGQADYYAALLRDGALIAQNREVLTLNDIGLVDVGEIVPLPTLLKERWYYRADLKLTWRRRITRYYPVLNLLEADATITGANASGVAAVDTVVAVAP